MMLSRTLALSLVISLLISASAFGQRAEPWKPKPETPEQVQARLEKALAAGDVVLVGKIASAKMIGQTRSMPPSNFGQVTLGNVEMLKGAKPKLTFHYSYTSGRGYAPVAGDKVIFVGKTIEMQLRPAIERLDGKDVQVQKRQITRVLFLHKADKDLLAITYSNTNGKSTTQPAGPVYKLPEDPRAAVLVMDSKGGMLRRVDKTPMLTVLADGTVQLASPYGMRKAMEVTISKDELQALLAIVLHTHNFEKVDPAKINQEMMQAKKMLHVADAATSRVKVDLPGHSHEASMYAVGIMARQFPDIQSLQDFDAILKHLRVFTSRIYAGGEKGIAQRLAVINKALLAEHEQARPLSPGDMTSATVFQDGTLQIIFNRVKEVNATTKLVTTGRGRFPVKGEPKVSTSHREVKVRPRFRPGPGLRQIN
jgi:hypothetical protein